MPVALREGDCAAVGQEGEPGANRRSRPPAPIDGAIDANPWEREQPLAVDARQLGDDMPRLVPHHADQTAVDSGASSDFTFPA